MQEAERTYTGSKKEVDLTYKIMIESVRQVYLTMGVINCQGGNIPDGWLNPVQAYRLHGRLGGHEEEFNSLLEELVKYGLATRNIEGTPDNHPYVLAAGGLIMAVALSSTIQAMLPKKPSKRVRAILPGVQNAVTALYKNTEKTGDEPLRKYLNTVRSQLLP